MVDEKDMCCSKKMKLLMSFNFKFKVLKLKNHYIESVIDNTDTNQHLV